MITLPWPILLCVFAWGAIFWDIFGAKIRKAAPASGTEGRANES